MFWFKSHVSSALLQLIVNDTFDAVTQLRRRDAIDRVIAAVHTQRAILTIAYFGAFSDIEPYITAANTTPKFVITQGCNEPLGAATVADKFSSDIFYIAVGQLTRNPMWQRMNDVLADRQTRVRGLFVVPRHVTRRQVYSSQVSEHFEWCWRNGFINAMVLVDDNAEENNKKKPFTVYGYDRFPQLRVRQMPVHAAWFSDKLKNFHRSSVRTTYQFDPPRAFQLQPWMQNNSEIVGYAAEMLIALAKTHNATLQLVTLNNSSHYNIMSVIDQIRRGGLDISMNLYFFYPGLRLSYPIRMQPISVLVPSSGEIERFRYFVRPFQTHTWFCFILGLLYLSLIRRLSDRISSYWNPQVRPSFGRGCLEVWRLLLFLPINTPCDRKCFHWHSASTLVLTALLGFMLTNLYQASLTSFLASAIFRPPWNTLASLVEHNVSINTNFNEIEVLRNSSSLSKDFFRLLIPRDPTELRDELMALKPNAYTACADVVHFVLLQQEHMDRKPLHECGESIATLPFGFLLPNRSPYEHLVNRFILRAQAAGLTIKWIESAKSDGFRAGILRKRKQKRPLKQPLNQEYFQFAWIVWSAGLLSALCGFALENLCYFTQSKKLMLS
ncbi:PREDICTED: uncharacterized protein LOC108369249 [Rhagoletis zephyria]|uniref:uncharacterized protein LOC108369249 n=1 Tax=Rhagoletis zephyria TaxID=28612 RepID=UPI0008118957|nr:PREDICTED: uncharacterized protein LOC108369249 [Rhagoletis zephyria]